MTSPARSTLYRRGVRVLRSDVVVALVVAVLVLLDLLLVERLATAVGVTAVAGATLGLLLALRHAAPLALALLVGALLVVQSALGGQLTHMLSTVIVGMGVMFSTGLHLSRGRAVAGGLGFLAATWLELVIDTTGEHPLLSDLVFTGVVVVGGPWLAGRALRERRERTDELTALTAQLAAEREQTAQLAVIEERNRIAREMHDVVAHSVSLMVVQAGAARRILDNDPARSRTALLSAEDAGRQALAELRRVLGLLRGTPNPVELEPQPGLGQLGPLVDRARASGLDVRLTVHGCARDLPPGVDLAVYRVVQEALTNTLKHAGAACTAIDLDWQDDAVSVAVVDDGAGACVPAQPPGHGLVGMRERVAAYGGDVEAGPAQPTGFAIRARIPLGSPT
jgi:signal transduction histidine kinase